MLLTLKAQGFDLILVWLLSIAIIYGILAKIKMPESYSARGAISVAAGFLIMLASVGTALPQIIEKMVSSMIVIGFVLLLVVIFLELMGIKSVDVLSKHAEIILLIIGGVAFLVFISSGAVSIFTFRVILSEATVAIILFLVLMSFVIWILAKEGGGGGS
jgi:hypothetical protein